VQPASISGDNILHQFFVKIYFSLNWNIGFSPISRQFKFFYNGFCTPFEVSRVVCGAHIRLLAPFALNASLVASNAGSTVREPFNGTHLARSHQLL